MDECTGSHENALPHNLKAKLQNIERHKKHQSTIYNLQSTLSSLPPSPLPPLSTCVLFYITFHFFHLIWNLLIKTLFIPWHQLPDGIKTFLIFHVSNILLLNLRCVLKPVSILETRSYPLDLCGIPWSLPFLLKVL